jgi:hypothetical protein
VDAVLHTTWSPIITKRDMFVTFNDDSSSFIHPQVKMSAVTTFLADTVALISESKHDFIARMTCPEDSNLDIYFVEGSSCHPSTESGLPPLKVYATRHFNGTSKPRFDCIKILLTETDPNRNEIISNAFAQVLRILAIHCLHEDKMNVFFVVTVLGSKEKMRGDKYLPYELLEYEKICNLKLSNQKNSFTLEY